MAKTNTDQRGMPQKCSVCGEHGHKASSHNVQTEKLCGYCGKTQPIESFYTIARRGRKRSHSMCIECDKKSTASRYRGSFRGKLVSLLCAARARSKQTGVDFTISIDFLMQTLKSQNHNCYYSGRPLSHDTGKSGVSIDRLDPALGYTEYNVVLTQWITNNMKCNLSVDEFRSICADIASR